MFWDLYQYVNCQENQPNLAIGLKTWSLKKQIIYYDCCKLIKCIETLGFWCRVGFNSVVFLGENHLNRSFSAWASSSKWGYYSPYVEHFLYNLVKRADSTLSESWFTH